MSLPDIPIPADFYDGGGRKEQVDALVAKVRVPAVSEKTQTTTLRGDATIVVTDGEGNAITAPALVDVVTTRDAISSDAGKGLGWVPDRQALTAWDEAEQARLA